MARALHRAHRLRGSDQRLPQRRVRVSNSCALLFWPPEAARSRHDDACRPEECRRMRIRHGILVALFAVAMALAPTGDPGGAEAPLPHDESLAELRIGYQKGGPLLILKSSGRSSTTASEHSGCRCDGPNFRRGSSAPREALNAGECAGNRRCRQCGHGLRSGGRRIHRSSILLCRPPIRMVKRFWCPGIHPIRTLTDLKGKTIAPVDRTLNTFRIRALERAHLGLR